MSDQPQHATDGLPETETDLGGLREALSTLARTTPVTAEQINASAAAAATPGPPRPRKSIRSRFFIRRPGPDTLGVIAAIAVTVAVVAGFRGAWWAAAGWAVAGVAAGVAAVWERLVVCVRGGSPGRPGRVATGLIAVSWIAPLLAIEGAAFIFNGWPGRIFLLLAVIAAIAALVGAEAAAVRWAVFNDVSLAVADQEFNATEAAREDAVARAGTAEARCATLDTLAREAQVVLEYVVSVLRPIAEVPGASVSRDARARIVEARAEWESTLALVGPVLAHDYDAVNVPVWAGVLDAVAADPVVFAEGMRKLTANVILTDEDGATS